MFPAVSSAPLAAARLVSLAVAGAVATAAGGTGINAFVKSNNEQARVKALAPKGTTVSINVNDVYHSGVIATTICGLIGVLAAASFLATLLRPHAALRAQAAALAFCAVWLLAVQIPVTHFIATREAIVTATLNGVPIPASFLPALEAALHTTPVYKHIGYLKPVAILPWFAAAAAAIASAVLFAAASRARRTPARALPPHSDDVSKVELGGMSEKMEHA